MFVTRKKLETTILTRNYKQIDKPSVLFTKEKKTGNTDNLFLLFYRRNKKINRSKIFFAPILYSEIKKMLCTLQLYLDLYQKLFSFAFEPNL